MYCLQLLNPHYLSVLFLPLGQIRGNDLYFIWKRYKTRLNNWNPQNLSEEAGLTIFKAVSYPLVHIFLCLIKVLKYVYVG